MMVGKNITEIAKMIGHRPAPAGDPLGRLYGHLADGLLDLDDAGGHDQGDRPEEDERQVVLEPAALALDGADDRPRGPADDAGEDDQRDAVADAVLGDQLPEPHQHHGAAGQGDDDRRALEPVHVGGEDAGGRVLEEDGEAVRLERRQRDGQVAAPAGDPPPPHLALLRDLLDPGRDDRHQLHDDGGVDVGVQAHRHDREGGEPAAAEEVEQAQ
jgi:hypothetical protein